jgi:hypothetical protein
MSNSKIQAVSGGRLDEQSTSEDDFEPVLRLNTRDGSVWVSVNGRILRLWWTRAVNKMLYSLVYTGRCSKAMVCRKRRKHSQRIVNKSRWMVLVISLQRFSHYTGNNFIYTECPKNPSALCWTHKCIKAWHK